MKTMFPFVASVAILLLLFSGCLEEDCQAVETYIGYEPLVVYPEEFRAVVDYEAARELCEPSTFYYYRDYMLVMERNEGIHFINNADPVSPVFEGFLPVIGGAGMSVHQEVLYVNSATDMLAFDLSDMRQPEMIGRTEDVFPAYTRFNQMLSSHYEEGAVAIDWIPTDMSREIDCSASGVDTWFWDEDVLFLSDRSLATNAVYNVLADQPSTAAPDQQGVGGSLARFTINNGTLYVVDDNNLNTFDISNPADLQVQQPISLGWGIETIFPKGDLLFIGSMSGMHIYDGSNALEPVRLSTFDHVTACDPVYVHADKAYVTLRSDNSSRCNNVTNRLEVIDISNPSDPRLIRQYDMDNPAGLSVTDDLLFLCEGDYGFKVFGLQPNGLVGEELVHHTGIDALDVIGLHWRNELITFDESGLAQFSYATNGELTELSRLASCQ